LVSSIEILTFDEFVLTYQPSHQVKEEATKRGEPIPVVFIKRKPHPNGLLLHLGSTYVEHPVRRDSRLPFLVEMLPHLTVGDSNPSNAIQKMFQR